MQEGLSFPAAPDPTKNLRKILLDSTILAVISEEAERKNSPFFFFSVSYEEYEGRFS